MEGQEFLYSSIYAKLEPNETLESIKHLSRTTLIEAPDYPAIFVEEEPYDFSQEVSKNEIVVRRYNCSLAIVVQSNNVNELTEAQYKITKDLLDEKTKEVIAVILEAAPLFDKLSNIKFGRGEVFDGVISSVPVMWNLIPVEITMIN